MGRPWRVPVMPLGAPGCVLPVQQAVDVMLVGRRKMGS